ncbi:M23 family metallopeptidase [Oryzobacter sp. R7]|uniref:M23 family metallopeptidase n=1 Tax=Oryzobacter faecalis TaxID=3388656 RepID=UPI00398CE5B0
MGRPDRAPTRTSRRAIALGTAVLAAAALASTSAQALPTGSDPGKDKKKVDAQIDKVREQLEDTSSDLAAAYVALQKTRAALPGAQAGLAKAEGAAAAADRANAVAAQELAAAVASEKKTEAELTETTTEVTESRTRVAQFAAQIYQEQGFGQLDMALTSSDPQQFADRIALVDTVMDVQSEAMERLASERASLAALEEHLSALRADSAAKKKQAEVALAKAKKARDAAARAKASLDALAARQASQAKTVESKLARDKAKLKGLQSEQARLKAILAKRAAEAKKKAAAAAAKKRKKGQSSGGGGGGGGGGGDGYLSRPSPYRVSSEYGMRFHPVYHYWKLHSGRDYAAPCGTAVRAAASGTVIMSGGAGGYGNRVVIDHGIVSGDSLATTYNHLQSIRKWSGHVSRGQVVGYVGTTGTSTGCHLHFETLEDGDFVDPRKWL